ncbi:virulence-associated E family protein [[Clostridium] innocuum]|nr:virulence-associated E family protein [[Clostridium] innocuum]
MRDLNIAYGDSRSARQWSNKTIRFEALKERLKVTVRTSESAEEYARFPKAKRDAAKDHGGFVAGVLKGGRRKIDTVESRSMVALDGDRITAEFLKDYEKAVPYASVLYTTHSHTDEAPRVRLVFPLTRDVSPEEYVAVARYLAQMLGMDYFDECSYQPNQLMYWPSTPSNGVFLYKETDKEWLDPDAVLSAHPEWTDPTRLPTSSRESRANTVAVQKVQDPLEKEGVVGLFNRVYYPVNLAIDAFLGDVYEPAAREDRYHLIESSSMAGVEIKENGKFVYSHHAKDPAYLKLCNAFDIVRIHKFGDEDEKKSFQQMCDFALTIEDVRLAALEDKRRQAGEDFAEDTDWRKNLELDRKGNIKDTLDNIVCIIRGDEELQGIAFNRHRDGIDTRGGLPWGQIKGGWNDSDAAALKVYLSKNYGIYSPAKTKDAVVAVAAERAYHPIREYLESLPEWDGIPRVDTLLIDYFGATDNSYTRAVSRKSMAAAIARIYQPGTKFDSVPILNGPQGVGKSTFYAKLAGGWFSDSLTLTDMKDKAGPEKLQGYWILELGELAGMRKADIETVKSFISRVDDKYRASYGVNVESHPRQCIIVGTTNAETGFLRDITGNRRFWPVRVPGTSKKKPWQITQEEVEQIWAETLVLYHKGEKLYLEGAEAEIAVNEQADALETDEREGLVREYLDTLLPEKWPEMSLFERRSYLGDCDFGFCKKDGTVQKEYVCNMEIWCECFGRDGSAMKPADSYAIAAIMRKMDGWEKTERTTYPIYGRQRGYRRKLS